MRTYWLTLGLLCALGLVSFLALAYGTVSIPFQELIAALWGTSSARPAHSTIIWQLRIPRLIAGLLTGYSLALAGCVMQGVFRNPLADPYLLGVAGGATSGAALCIALGYAALPFVLPISAFVGGSLAVGCVFIVAQSRWGRFSNTTLILVGVAVGAMFGSITSFLTFFVGNEQLQQIVFWTMGDLGALTWSQIPLLFGIVTLCSLGIWMFTRELDALALGEVMAQHLGLRPVYIKRILLGWITLLTAITVATVGTIGFVGLLVPHIVRLVCGPRHRLLLPLSGLTGALFLVLCDTLARTILQPHELPVGLITSLCGAPFFLYLLRHQLNESPR